MAVVAGFDAGLGFVAGCGGRGPGCCCCPCLPKLTVPIVLALIGLILYIFNCVIEPEFIVGELNIGIVFNFLTPPLSSLNKCHTLPLS